MANDYSKYFCNQNYVCKSTPLKNHVNDGWVCIHPSIIRFLFIKKLPILEELIY